LSQSATGEDVPIYPCDRCGILYFTDKMWYLANRDGREHRWCMDCNRTPQVYVEYFTIKGERPTLRCIAWRGEFDADNEPIDALGNRFTGDIALCGHRDCVTREHRPDMTARAKGVQQVKVRHRPPQSIDMAKLQLFIKRAAQV